MNIHSRLQFNKWTKCRVQNVHIVEWSDCMHFKYFLPSGSPPPRVCVTALSLLPYPFFSQPMALLIWGNDHSHQFFWGEEFFMGSQKNNQLSIKINNRKHSHLSELNRIKWIKPTVYSIVRVSWVLWISLGQNQPLPISLEIPARLFQTFEPEIFGQNSMKFYCYFAFCPKNSD